MDLQEIYKKESGYDVGRYNIDNTNYYSEDYVEWLEKKLRIGSVTYQGITYNWGDKVVSPNGYEFFVVTDDGRWGLVDHGGTFCELQHCDLTGYLHCH